MDSSSSFIPLKPRVHRKRRADSPSAGPPPARLVVTQIVNVIYDEPLLSFTVVFNTTEEAPLAGMGDPVDALKWNARYQGNRFAGYDAYVSAFNTVIVTLSLGEAESGADEVNYTNDPSDISDTLGRALAAFSGYPL